MSFIKSYFKFTRHGYYSFILILPLFMVYETGIWWVDKNSQYKVRNLVDFALKYLISTIGVSVFFWVTVGSMLILLVLLKPRKEFLFFHWSYLPVLAMESLVYSLVFSSTVFLYDKLIFSAAETSKDQLTSIILSCGAGFYEELVFRVILFGIVIFMLKKFLNIPVVLAAILSALLSSVLFSGIHYIGEAGDKFTLYSFVYRIIGGLFFCLVYQLRGFAVAVYTHTIYDILVVFTAV